MGDADALPQAHIKRIVKAKLAELTAGEGDQKREVSVQKEALSAFAESARIFIHFLTATANEVCHENKRLTINAEDVLKAVEEVDFHDFVEPLREALAGALAAGFGRAGLWREALSGRSGADAHRPRCPPAAQRSRPPTPRRRRPRRPRSARRTATPTLARRAPLRRRRRRSRKAKTLRLLRSRCPTTRLTRTKKRRSDACARNEQNSAFLPSP